MGHSVILGRTLAGAVLLGAAGAVSPARGEGSEIRIGESSSYSARPSVAEPYRKGWQLAVDQINIAGGIGGRKLTVLSKDDAGKPAEALAAAGELVARDHVALLAGGLSSQVGLALSGFARQHRIVYLAGEPLTDALVWSAGNRYTFRLRPSIFMQAAMLADEAAKLPAKTWVSIAPNCDDGRSAVAAFRTRLAARRPDVTWVAEQWSTPGRIDARLVAVAIVAARPDAILNVEAGPDLLALLREGGTSGLFEDHAVVSFSTGDPEALEPLKDEAPEGWLVTGYPLSGGLHTADDDAFAKAYQARYNEAPKMSSVLGYTLIEAAAAMLRKAGSIDTEHLIGAAEGLAFDSPFGRAEFRAVDHQSTLGTFTGRTAQRNNRGVMVDYTYRDGARYLPGDADAKAMRPGE